MRTRRRWVIALGVAAWGAFAVAAELVADTGVADTLADLATGLTMFGCGLWGARRRPRELCWPLLAFAGVAWFAGNFAAAGTGVTSALGGALLFLHRGPLVHASATARRDRSRLLAGVTIAAGYAAVLVTGSSNGVLTLIAAVLVSALAMRGVTPRGSRHDLLVSGSRLLLAGALTLAGVSALAHVSSGTPDGVLFGYEAGLCASMLLLSAALVSETRSRATLADLVVRELGPARRSGTVRNTLARALGDASLQIGYAVSDTERYVDADGRPLVLLDEDAARATTFVERDGEPIAVLVHDRAALDDRSLIDAVREAAALLLSNARLETEVATQLGELRASRVRIIQARDEQRRRLARRLHDGAERRLREVAAAVGRARAQTPAEPRHLDLLDLLEHELDQARGELADLARGIHPRILTDSGLAAALSALADRAAVPIELITPTEPWPAPVEAAAYFVCSEAMTNVAKYARASHVRCVVLRRDGRVHVSVVDDGVGGADPTRGSGLRGLADRIDALGGTFEVVSPAGKGTAVRAELPLDGAW